MDVESDTVSVSRLLASKSISPALARRIRSADADNNGELSLHEVLEVMKSEERAIADRRLFVRILVALGVGLLLLAAATAGMTYGIVVLSKDVSDSGNVLVSKSTGQTMATGKALSALPVTQLYLADPSLFQSFDKLTLSNSEGGVDVYAVSSVSFVPNVSATVNTTSGKSFYVDSAGIHDDSAVASGGRRRLQDWNDFVSFVTFAANTLAKDVAYAVSAQGISNIQATVNSITSRIKAGWGSTIAQVKTFAVKSANQVATGSIQLVKTLGQCSTWEDIILNDPCTQPLAQLQPLHDSYIAQYNAIVAGLPTSKYTTSLPSCWGKSPSQIAAAAAGAMALPATAHAQASG